MGIYFLLLLSCLSCVVYSDEIYHKIEGTSNATHIYTMLKNYIQSDTNPTSSDTLFPSSEPKIHNLYVIMANDSTDQGKQYDQTFILSKNLINSATNVDSTLNINDNLRFKVTEIIGVDKILDGTAGTQTKTKLDMTSIQENLEKRFAQKDSTKTDKLRSIIIRRRKLDSENLLMESQTGAIEKNHVIKETRNPSDIVMSNTSDSAHLLSSDGNLLFNNPTTIGKQIDNLEMIPFTPDDAIVSSESTLQEYNAKPEKTSEHTSVPPNHATVYKPIVHIDNGGKMHKEQIKNTSLNNKKDLKVFYTRPYNVEDGEVTLPANNLMQFISSIMFGSTRQYEPPSMRQRSNMAVLPTESLLIVGPIPKPLPSHLVYEPYKSQFVLPNL